MSDDVFESSVVATGLLADFSTAGAISWNGVQLARTLSWLTGEQRPEVLLAVALCLRAQESGSVCLPIDDLQPPPEKLAWPDRKGWLSMLADSPLVAVGDQPEANQRPLRLVDRQLYLERNWQSEERVRIALTSRISLPPPPVCPEQLNDAFEQARSLATSGPVLTTAQRDAVRTSISSWTSVIAGGPGTGKTTTIAQLLRVLDNLVTTRTSVALASFTGKAAARMQESLDASLAGSELRGPAWQHLQVRPATTLHALLGARPGGHMTRNAGNPLPHDLLIIDEMSMVSLDLMAALMAALRPTTRLVMVGDPHQLSSVDAGAVLADIVSAGLPMSSGDPQSAITELTDSHRFTGPIQELAEAIQAARTDDALDLLRSGGTELAWIDVDPDPQMLASIEPLARQITVQGQEMVSAARQGRSEQALAAMDAHRLLCAHRHGPYGVGGWSRAVEAEIRKAVPGYARTGEWYLGRPLLITRNAPDLQISNGDTGVVVLIDDQIQVALSSGDQPRLRSPWLLDSSETMHAMTVHKSQGSEYNSVTVVLPATGSPLLTRELFYTAVTRAQKHVRILGSAEAIAQAINTPARRATGLGRRLNR
ncbi:MAG: exodeoxyribonuclease V subunit alpha [Propionibacterium sp.]|nr:exodeoxyribonuclease V subunit alpha [Propionibacterium sp.]